MESQYQISEANQIEAGCRGLIIEPCQNGEYRWEADCGSGYEASPEACEAAFVEQAAR